MSFRIYFAEIFLIKKFSHRDFSFQKFFFRTFLIYTYIQVGGRTAIKNIYILNKQTGEKLK